MAKSLQGPAAGSGASSIVMVLGAAILVLFPYALLMHALPIGRDSGVFMYTGMLMNSGGMPYIDSWDHKGPLLYIFNAAGFFLVGSPLGIILLEGTLLFASLVISMHLWKRLLSTSLVLLVAALLLLTYYAIFEKGNLTESWLIPFTLITYSLALVYCCEEDADKKDALLPWLCVSLGVSVAVAALTRLNNGLALGFLTCYLLGWGTKHRLRSLFLIGIAFAAVALPVLLWVYQKNALHDFVEQYWAFNFAYTSGATTTARIIAAYALSQAIFFSPLGIVSIFVCATVLFSEARQAPKGRNYSVCWLMLAIFFIELLSQMVSGRGYLHYALLAAAPLAVVLVALLNYVDAQGRRILNIRKNGEWALLLIPAVLLVLMQMSFTMMTPLKHGVRIAGTPENQLAAHVRQNTNASDLVLVHGAQTWLLVAAGRRSPTNITYYYPVLAKFKDASQKYQSDVIREKPMYIVEAPEACGLTGPECAGQPELFEDLRNFLTKNYVFESEMHGYKFWRIQEAGVIRQP